MTVDQIYKSAINSADLAFADYKATCEKIKEGKEIEIAANTALNALIAMCWQLKSAALAREPAHTITRAAQRKAVKEGKQNAKKSDSE